MYVNSTIKHGCVTLTNLLSFVLGVNHCSIVFGHLQWIKKVYIAIGD